MAALLAVPSEPLKKREGLRHLMATSLLCHLPRYTCAEQLASQHSPLSLHTKFQAHPWKHVLLYRREYGTELQQRI